MEIIIALIVLVVVGSIIYFNREAKSLDVNKDGKVDTEDVKVAVETTVAEVKQVAKRAKATVKKATTAKKPATKVGVSSAKTAPKTRGK
jgi:hypothetical protein